MKKVLIVLAAVLLIGAAIGMATTVVEETIGTIATLDPAWSYDTASGEAIWQLYDNLIQYKGSSLKEFAPMISTNVPSEKDGTILDNGKTYIFHIRQGVFFHNGDILTPEDVKYSFERVIIFDRSGGPTWMLAEPLLKEINGAYVDSIEQWAAKLAGVKSYSDLFIKGTKTPKNAKYKQALIDAFNMLDKDFEIKGNDLIIHLPHAYPPFLYILAHGANWSAIVDKKWAIENGAWDGKANDWWKYHNPTREKDPLYSIEDGSGPFTLERWTKGREIVFKRFDHYWDGPAKIEYGIIKRVNEFTTRKLDLMQGNADIIAVPQQYMSQVENLPGVKIVKGLPELVIDDIFFNWNVNAKGNPYIGSGKLDGKGIPADFFSNEDVRKAFIYLFPYKTYIKQVLNGQAIIPNGCIPKGMLGYNANVPPTYRQDLAKATEYFKKAYNGELWKKGFTMTIVYNSGNVARRTACEMIRAFARRINPKFNIQIKSELWASFLDDYLAGKLPLFALGWLADYPDPYDFAQPYYGSAGAYGSTLGKNYVAWAKKNMDALINESMKTTDPAKRAKIYEELNQKAYDIGYAIWTAQPLGHVVMRSDLKGWYYNAMRPGIDFYSLYK
ncbi:ABC transporter substrate-binding protein [Mesoaciditoga sp.]